MKCYYHNDIDGKCAGSVVARKTGNYNPSDYIMYDYSTPLNFDAVEEGETVYFVDLSFSVNTVDKLKELVETKKCNLIWCDHHQSSMEVMKNNPEYKAIKGIRRNGISGAALTYMYLYECEYEEIPTFIRLVSDFDCWLFKMEHTLEFKYAIEAKDHDALDIIWNKLMRDNASIMKTYLNKLFDKGKIISKYVKKEYEEYRKKYAYESRIDNYKCLVVNRSCNSLIFGNLIKEYPIVAIWAFDGEQYKYSIYSDKPEVDCSKIAEKFGGGGHKGASGFTSKELILKKEK